MANAPLKGISLMEYPLINTPPIIKMEKLKKQEAMPMVLKMESGKNTILKERWYYPLFIKMEKSLKLMA